MLSQFIRERERKNEKEVARECYKERDVKERVQKRRRYSMHTIKISYFHSSLTLFYRFDLFK